MLKTVGNPSTRYGDQTILSGNLVIGTSGNPAAGIPLVPGAVEILRFTSEAYFSGKASENTTLYITPGTGL
jgi:hypothetical protein